MKVVWVVPSSLPIVPADKWYHVVNVGQEQVKLYSMYSPPEHSVGTARVPKADADALPITAQCRAGGAYESGGLAVRRAFEEARDDRGYWRRVLRPLQKSTAQQMASDICSGRDEHRRRFGHRPGEEWSASYDMVGDSWFVRVRLEKGSVA